MASKIDTVKRRKALAPRREPYWHKTSTGRYLGYRRTETGGTWIARLRADHGGQHYQALGEELTFDEAIAAALEWFSHAETVEDHHYKVQDAISDYIEHLKVNNSQATATETKQRLEKHVPDSLMDSELTKLRTAPIKRWHQSLVRISDDDEDVRRSKDGANKLLSKFKAALNLASRSGLVATDREWRRVQPFKNVGAARTLFLTEGQVKELLENVEGRFHDLIKAAVLTGARYGELCAARVRDLDLHRGILTLSGKTGKRDGYLADEALVFFKVLVRDKLPDAWIFIKEGGDPWGKSHQHRPMKEAVKAAKLPAETVFYSLRHYHISKALVAGIPPQIVAENCGTSIRMIEKHYGKFMPKDRLAMLNKVVLL